MSEEKKPTYSEKEILPVLIDIAQHTATREELNRVHDKLDTKIDAVADKLESKIDRLGMMLISSMLGLLITIIVGFFVR